MKPRRRTLMDEVQEDLRRRREALRNGGAGLVVVRCRHCGLPIATTSVDRARGEPPILLDFPENVTPNRWVCTKCAKPFTGTAPQP